MIKFDFNDMLYALSHALDCVEHELVGVTTNHSKRVAYMCILMGEKLGLSDNKLIELVTCAILHDNALTEYIRYEYLNNAIDILGETESINIGMHCSMGEVNRRRLCMSPDAEGSILYHHEHADGSGAFGKKEAETPLYAQLIHLADQVDANLDLGFVDQRKYEQLVQYVKAGTGTLFSEKCAAVFLESFTYSILQLMQKERIDILLRERLPDITREYESRELLGIAAMFAAIVDYKSEFTRRHSLGIAEKASKMAEHLGYGEDMAAQLYFAGALHDVGKLVVDKEVLEKPGKLTDEEYRHIQNHAYYTYDILRRVKGLDDITRWASLHHEKLDGSGYPFGKKAEELDQLERMMACLDIYQALTEERPYKKGMEHQAALVILQDMAEKGKLDPALVKEIDTVFGNKEETH